MDSALYIQDDRLRMKGGYNKILNNQHNKDEIIVYVIKRLFGEHITSRQIKMQNRELIFRCITYNLHRHVKLVIIRIFSTQLYLCNHLYMNTNSLL